MDISSGRTIAIRIAEEPTTDGRRYLRSPDLKGFHFILDPEDSRDAILPTLKAFIQSYLSREVHAIEPSLYPNDFLAQDNDSVNAVNEDDFSMYVAAVG